MLTEEIKKEVLKINEDFRRQDADKYDFWENHIKFVVDESLKLAEAYGADKEIVEIGAMLHDIALMSRVGTKADHHVNGAKVAEEILDKFNIEENKKQRILGCVLHHRTSKNAENLEELCVADADILAHFDNIPMIFFKCYKLGNMTLENREEMKQGFAKDFDDLSEKTKPVFEDRYNTIMDVLFR